jgi:hypothetical protein
MINSDIHEAKLQSTQWMTQLNKNATQRITNTIEWPFLKI